MPVGFEGLLGIQCGEPDCSCADDSDVNEPLPGWEQGEVVYGLTSQEWRARS